METRQPRFDLVDAAEAGFDAARLQRLDRHLKRYVDEGRLAGLQLLVSRAGAVFHHLSYGLADKEAARPVQDDTIWRIYSMTKPITSVAAMMLWEEGAFELSTPIRKLLPEFEKPMVYVRGNSTTPLLTPATEPIRVWHLLTHTSGLTYGFFHTHAVDEAYRAAGYEFAWPQGRDLAGACADWARLPLLFQPGSEWNYGVSTDVLGRLVEVVSGQSLDAFFRERILEPLGMPDTAFWVSEEQRHRLAALYALGPGLPGPVRYDAMGDGALSRPSMLSGGGGLVGTAADYHRFCQMLLRGGELDGVRLLAPRTVELMTTNHLPGGADLEQFGRPVYAETFYAGTGFGLGVAVVFDPIAAKTAASPGEYSWGGLASTAFWVDPMEEVVGILMTQLVPSSTYPIRTEVRQLLYSAMVE